jgi:hypothetical protein
MIPVAIPAETPEEHRFAAAREHLHEVISPTDGLVELFPYDMTPRPEAV